MRAAPQTIGGLIGRFQLRRRATDESFSAGVQLARLGAVSLESVSPSALSAVVSDPEPLSVRIDAGPDGLVGHCACGDGDMAICRHQVAAAHALWLRNRRQLPPPPRRRR